jgi:cell division septation protein DedD
VVIAADMPSKKQREDTAADGPDDLGLDPELDPGPGYDREEELEPELALRLDPGPELDSDLDSGFELDGELNLESGLELDADLGMGSALDLDSDLDSDLVSDLDSDLGMESALDLDSDLGMESALDLEAGLGTQASHDLESDPYREPGSSRDANLNLDTNLDLDAAFAAGVGFELDTTLAQAAEPAGGFAAGSEVEVESELEMDSGLTLEPYEEESDGIDFESVEDFHPDFDDELDLADADLELEPISAEDAQDPDAPDGADVLAGPIAEALEALRAGAPTAPLAQEPLPPGPPPSNPTAAQAQIRASKSPARNGPIIALVCILLVVVGMLAAGMFRLNDTLMGLEQRIAGEGSVVRGVQQPKMGEELWVEMRQRNERLAGQVEALQTRLSDQTVTDAATAGHKLPETEDGVVVTSPAADVFGPDSPVPDVFREEAAVTDIATTEESTLPAQTVALPPLVQSNSPGWFINMGSFGSYEAAGQWAATLDPGSYAVEVSAISRDGKDLYRVRVVGIEDRLAARSLAQRFQQELYLNQLWVGKD